MLSSLFFVRGSVLLKERPELIAAKKVSDVEVVLHQDAGGEVAAEALFAEGDEGSIRGEFREMFAEGVQGDRKGAGDGALLRLFEGANVDQKRL